MRFMGALSIVVRVFAMACFIGCSNSDSPVPLTATEREVELQARQQDLEKRLLRAEIRAVLDADNSTAVNEVAAGGRLEVAGTIQLTEPETGSPGPVTVKIRNRRNVVQDSRNARPTLGDDNQYHFATDLSAPTKPGAYTLEASVRGKPIVQQTLTVR